MRSSVVAGIDSFNTRSLYSAVMRLLVLVAGCCCLIALSCSAQTRGPVRPVGKDVKIGGRGKNYVVLAQPFIWSQTNVVGLVVSEGLPAGIYRVKFEDDNGYYLPAPGRIGAKMADAVWPYEGGLYVRKDKPNVFYVYTFPPGEKTTIPSGKMVRAHPKLPWDFVRQLRQ